MTPTMFNVFVTFQADREKQFPMRYPVRNYGTLEKPRYQCAPLDNDGYHDYDAYDADQVGVVIMQLHRKYPGTIQEVIVQPARDWQDWIDTAQGDGNRHHSSGCEAAYLMTH